MAAEIDLVEAVTSADPGLAYRAALEKDRISWSGVHSCWMAVRPADVDAVLSDERCVVRPPGEPVPAVLVGTSLGGVFSRLARMNDGESHEVIRRAVERSLATIDLAAVVEVSRDWARLLSARGDLDRFVTALPASAMAGLLGVADKDVARVADLTTSVTRAIAPGASAEDVGQGCEAVGELCGLFAGIVEDDSAPSVVSELGRVLADEGQHDPEIAVANLIGFLIQSHDATAGLIGNTLVNLARDPDPHRTRDAISRLVVEVARRDPSVHNTRRYATQSMRVGGAKIEAGDTILVGLAAANLADNERSWSFGAGRHACPGRDIALTIAVEGVLVAHEAGLAPESVPDGLEYRPLGNVRIPRFASIRSGKDAE